jgi:predicted protein tyrosine phosphatase
MKLPTRSIGNLQHKMQGLNLSIFTHHLKNDRVLDIPDDYDYMDPALVQLLQAKVSRFLGG